jgi:methionine sulfoxide reductase heme-binding subunit
VWKQFFLNPWTKRGLFAICLIPAGLLIWRAFNGRLGANPVEFIEHATGDWAIRFLLITLAVTPLRKIFDQPQLARYRKMLGLFAFFYTFVHLMMYLIFDQMFDLEAIFHDVAKRLYIMAGMAGFLMMVPLAITSTAAMVRRMGAKNWQRLHRLTYFATLAGIVHYYWLVKSDIREPAMYAAILLVEMLYRVRMWTAKKPRPVEAASARR